MERSSSLTQVVSANATAGPLTFEDLFADGTRTALPCPLPDHREHPRGRGADAGRLPPCPRTVGPHRRPSRVPLSVRAQFDAEPVPTARVRREAAPDTRPARGSFAAADLRDEMVRGLRALPERQRAALVLLDLLDYRSEDAAEVLGNDGGNRPVARFPRSSCDEAFHGGRR